MLPGHAVAVGEIDQHPHQRVLRGRRRRLILEVTDQTHELGMTLVAARRVGEDGPGQRLAGPMWKA